MEAVDQLASAGTFRVVKEPLAFLRVLEWGKYSTSAPDPPEADVQKTPAAADSGSSRRTCGD